jgi:hypothetical protein
MREGQFKLKVFLDDEPIVKAKANNPSDFDPIMRDLKAKFNGSKRPRY